MSQWQALEAELKSSLGEAVRFNTAHRATYASDASNYRQVPIEVLVPKTLEDFVRAVAICYAHGASLLMRGGGTSMNGQAVNNAVVFDLSAFCDRIVDLDLIAGTAFVEPGVVCDSLRDAAERHGLTFAPDPSPRSRCTLGGMSANNSCGPTASVAASNFARARAARLSIWPNCSGWRSRAVNT